MKKKINILQVVNALPLGGLEKIVYDLSVLVDPDRYTVQICCLTAGGVIADELIKQNIKVHVLRAHNKMDIKHMFINIVQIFRLAYLIRKEHIDIIHSHEFFPAGMSRLASIFALKFKVIITLHNSYIWLSPIHHKINKWLSFFTRQIVAVSKDAMNHSIAHDRIHPKKYKIIYNGISADKPALSHEEETHYKKLWNLKGQETLIGNIGNLSFRKGQDTLIKALPSIIKKYPDVKAVIIGGMTENEPDLLGKLQALTCELNIKDHVIFAGSIPDAERLIPLFHIYIMPSVVEGFGLSLAEAMLNRKVCIASDLNVFKEIITDYTDGFFFKVSDPNDLSDKIHFALQMSNDQLQSIGEKARDKALRCFSKDRMIHQYQELYTSLLR